MVAAGIRCRLAKGQMLSDDPVIARILAALRVVLHPKSELLLEHFASQALPETVQAVVHAHLGMVNSSTGCATTPGRRASPTPTSAGDSFIRSRT